MSSSSTTSLTPLYLFYDIEADGPVPGLNSMMSFGASLQAYMENSDIPGLEIQSWQYTLKPLEGATQHPDTMKWWKTQPEAYKFSTENQQDPAGVMKAFANQLDSLTLFYDIVPLAYPSDFDWQWLNYYFHRFTGRNPLGYGGHHIGSYAWALKGGLEANGIGDFVRKYSDPTLKVTHCPLDDARAQGAEFMGMLRERNRNGLVVSK